MALTHRLLLAALATLMFAVAPASVSAAVILEGAFSTTYIKPAWTGSTCPANVQGDECGVIQLAGLGPATFVYVFGPTFAPNGTRGCFDVDGTLTLMLQSDNSTIAGPLIGVFCGPGASHHPGSPSYGNPFREDDRIAFAAGSGQFTGLSGTASFHTQFAGADFRGTLTGTLSG